MNLSRFLTLAICLISISLFAQPKDNDPYTLIGLGNFQNQQLATLEAMPGLAATYYDPAHINIQNPAANGYLYFTALEAGGFFHYKNLEAGNATDKAYSGNLSYLTLGFPIFNPINEYSKIKRTPVTWGMSFNLSPYTNVGYNLETITNQTDIGDIEANFQGSGGTYKISWANGVRYKDFSLGIDLGYVFGKINKIQLERPLELGLSYFNEIDTEERVNGFVWNAGALYSYNFKQTEAEKESGNIPDKLTIGLYGSSGSTLSSNFSSQTLRIQEIAGIPTDIDTFNLVQNEGNINLPAQFGVGIMYSKSNKLKIGVNYNSGVWSEYTNDNSPTIQLEDAMRVSFGAEYQPEPRIGSNYLKNIRYRLGMYYGTDPRVINGEQVSELGFTLGFGFPVYSSRSRGVPSSINLALTAGQFGNDSFVNQNFFRVTLGFTLNDNEWFIKRKYN